MKKNQTLWLIAAAVALYYGSVYCEELPKALAPMLPAWFGGRALPGLSQYALDISRDVAGYGPWLAGFLLILAAWSFSWNRRGRRVEESKVALLNAVGYYTARAILLGLAALAILQAHGILIILLNVDEEIRKELGKPIPTLNDQDPWR